MTFNPWYTLQTIDTFVLDSWKVMNNGLTVWIYGFQCKKDFLYTVVGENKLIDIFWTVDRQI